jgi:carbonic anhydrase
VAIHAATQEDRPLEAYDRVLAANETYVASGEHRDLPVRPSRHLAIVTCMDCRLPAFPVLGLDLGDAHILRNAGARVTDDVLRSLALSTHVLGTREVLVIGHTRCGVFDPEGSIESTLTDLMGHRPFNQSWGTFTDPEESIRADCDRLLRWPDRPTDFRVAGLLLDIESGGLLPVVPPQHATPADGAATSS